MARETVVSRPAKPARHTNTTDGACAKRNGPRPVRCERPKLSPGDLSALAGNAPNGELPSASPLFGQAGRTKTRARVIGLLAMAVFGCHQSSSMPAVPGGVDLSGRWRGQEDDSSGVGTVWWEIVQKGTSIAGSMKSEGTGGRMSGNISGTVDGSRLSFVISIPLGSVEEYPHCSAEARGTASVSAAMINGTLSGTNSCFGAFSGGNLQLFRSEWAASAPPGPVFSTHPRRACSRVAPALPAATRRSGGHAMRQTRILIQSNVS